ncbi:hypothetical protein FH972_026690 [Carpinus fangiana]|uniref:Uncharacterized protein n=1 Tax=Carpinus fangiana TaxID=176857 RepID=A0A5N6L4R0_9ROSI|nr:hypothetical protein FH972_026690 [Carpinus fangiana]
MATIVLMLENHSVSLQLPQHPAFLLWSREKRNIKTKEMAHDDSTTSIVHSTIPSIA